MLHSVIFRVLNNVPVFSRVYSQPFQGLIKILHEFEVTDQKESYWKIMLISRDVTIDTWKIYLTKSSITIYTKKISGKMLPYKGFRKTLEELADILNQDIDGYGYNLTFKDEFDEINFKLKFIDYIEVADYKPLRLSYLIRKIYEDNKKRLILSNILEKLEIKENSTFKEGRIFRLLTFKNGRELLI